MGIVLVWHGKSNFGGKNLVIHSHAHTQRKKRARRLFINLFYLYKFGLSLAANVSLFIFIINFIIRGMARFSCLVIFLFRFFITSR